LANAAVPGLHHALAFRRKSTNFPRMRKEANKAPWNTGRAMAYGAVIGVIAEASD